MIVWGSWDTDEKATKLKDEKNINKNNCLSKWKVLQYFVRRNSASGDAFGVRAWKWWTMLDFEMPSSPDTLQVLLARFASMAKSMVSEYIVLGLPDLA